MRLLQIELGLSIVAIALAFIAPRLGDGWFSRIEQGLSRFAKRRRLAVFTTLFLALGLRLAVLPIEPIPHPGVHDEFSHLLIADTLAHGRLANPTPALWEHFETFHENFVPAYASMYYPGQGLFLALGQIVFGHPFWGVWLSSGLMCAAFCWALQAWVPPGWALLAGFLTTIRLGMFSYWGNSYWGGALAALGGALVVGSLPRIMHSYRTRDGFLMGIGFAILANTRPFESLFLCAPIALGLQLFLLIKVRPHIVWLQKVVLPVAVVTGITMALMAFYFYRTTGSPFTIPYQLNMRRYGYVYFPWQHFNTAVAFNHPAMRALYVGELMETARSYRAHPVIFSALRLIWMWSFFLGPGMTIPLILIVPAMPPRQRIASFGWGKFLLVLTFILSFVGVFLPYYFSVHYAAASTCMIYVLYVMSVRRVFLWRPWHKPVGAFLVRSTVVICIIVAIVFVAVPASRPPFASSLPTWCSRWHPLDRTRIEQQVAGKEKQLILVRYSRDHDPVAEWVFNGADIDTSKIIWARDMGPEKNQELIEHYSGRFTWLLEPDKSPLALVPYSSSYLSEATIEVPKSELATR